MEALSSAYNEVGIECSFRRKLDTGDDGMDFPLTLPLYLFYGMANDPSECSTTQTTATQSGGPGVVCCLTSHNCLPVLQCRSKQQWHFE